MSAGRAILEPARAEVCSGNRASGSRLRGNGYTVAMWEYRVRRSSDQQEAEVVRLTIPNPALSALVILAVGIGANTATFSLANGLLLRPLPYPDPDDIVSVGQVRRNRRTPPRLSSSELLRLWDVARTFEYLAAYVPRTMVLSGRDGTVNFVGAVVTPSLFPLLRATPRLGRLFDAADALEGAHRVVLLSHRAWSNRFGSDPDVIGTPLLLNEEQRTVVGVLPVGFEFPDRETDFWTPLVVRTHESPPNGSVVIQSSLSGIGRLRSGVSLNQAAAEVRTILDRIRAERPLPPGMQLEPRVTSLQEERGDPFRSGLLMLAAATGLILFMTCANVAGLLLSHGIVRQRELALRGALGARRGRIVHQLLTESVVLSLAGGLAGVVVAAGLVRVSSAVIGVAEVNIDGTVLVFAAGLSVTVGLLFGIAPALAGSAVNLVSTLNGGSGSAAGVIGRVRTNHLQAVLAVIQVALALVLLTGAGLLLRSFVTQVALDYGIDPTNVLTARIDNPARMFGGSGGLIEPDELEAMNATTRRVTETLLAQMERMRGLPGVEAVALSSSNTPFRFRSVQAVRVLGEPLPSDQGERLMVGIRRVSAEYAAVVRLRLRAGRFITDRDTAGGSHVAVVSESLAREAFSGGMAVGQYLVTPAFRGQDGAADATIWEVIGVVDDVTLPFRGGLGAPDSAGEIYVPMARSSPARGPFVDTPAVFVRTAGDGPAVGRFLRDLLVEVAPGSLVTTTSVTAMLSAQTAQPRFYATLAGLFGAVALLLAAFGLYSVLSYTVSQRRREIGIRMALGAGPRDILLLVIGQGCALVGVGVILGVLAAAATNRILESVLFGVTAADPLTFSVVATVLLAVGLLACWLPARRAVRIDPLDTLRET